MKNKISDEEFYKAFFQAVKDNIVNVPNFLDFLIL